jgi:hypothetical protein
MTIDSLRLVAVLAIAGLATACNNSSPANPPAAYDAISLTGSQLVGGGILRINFATGETVVAWDGKSVPAAVVLEDAPVPAGRYQVYAWSTITQADDKVHWNAIRMDQLSGRLWRLDGDGASTPFSWSEIAVPAKTTK